MAFIVYPEIDKTFYQDFITKHPNDVTKKSFTKYWFAQKISYGCTEDDYLEFMDFYCGKCIFEEFTVKYGASGDVRKFLQYCDNHRDGVMDRFNISSLQFMEPETEIYRYWMTLYVEHWVKKIHTLSIASLKDATINLTMRMYELDVPCANNRTCDEFVKYIPKVLTTLSKDQQTKWCIICSGDAEEAFARSMWKPCVCIDCDQKKKLIILQ